MRKSKPKPRVCGVWVREPLTVANRGGAEPAAFQVLQCRHARHLNLHAHAPKPTPDPMTEDYRVMIYAAIRTEIEKRLRVPASVAHSLKLRLVVMATLVRS